MKTKKIAGGIAMMDDFTDMGMKMGGMVEMKKEGKTYPGLHLDKHVPGLDMMKPGDEGVVVAKVRMKSMSKHDHGESMGFDVLGVKDINPGPGAKKGRGKSKVHTVMSEFKRGTLRSGSGGRVKGRKQAIAIAMSEAGMSKKGY